LFYTLGRLSSYTARAMHALTFVVHRAAMPPAPTPDWNAPAWRDVPCLEIALPVGGAVARPGGGAVARPGGGAVARPGGGAVAHRPHTVARLAWDDECLHVVFRVEDRYVRAVVDRYQGPVCTDSCVELFFTPGTDLSEGYFNIEVNCGGVVLFHHQHGRGVPHAAVAEQDGRRLGVAHTMPARVEPEIPGPVTWLVAYRVPFEVLERYAPVARPRPGAAWRANLYKCGDATSHPHWLSWSPVEVPAPDFHRPERFGTLGFVG